MVTKKSIMELEKHRVGIQGIKPRASRMRSKRSTISATSLFGFYSSDMESYWIGSVLSQLELATMARWDGSGFVSNFNRLRIAQHEPKPFIKPG